MAKWFFGFGLTRSPRRHGMTLFAKRTAGVDVKRPLQTAAVDVAVGREARLMAQRNKKGRLRIREAIVRL
jgi:hypothetical protein